MNSPYYFSKIIVHKYYNPISNNTNDLNSKIEHIESNIEFNKDGYYMYDYTKIHNLSNVSYLDFEEEEEEEKEQFNNNYINRQALRYKDDDIILQNHYCKSINLNKQLLNNDLFLENIRKVCEINNLKYIILSSSSTIKNIWSTNDFKDEDKNHDSNQIKNAKDYESPFTNTIQLKLIGLQTDLETSYPLLLKLRSQFNSSTIFIKNFDFESYKLLPLIFGYKKGDLKSLCDYYKVDIFYPNLLCNMETFISQENANTNLYILSINSETDVTIVYNILEEKLQKLKSEKSSIIIKNLNNLNNDYINFDKKLKYFHNDMDFLQILNNLMFEYSCFIELNLKLKQIFIIGNYEVFILNVLKVVHLKVYNKVYEFNITFKNDENYDQFKQMVLNKEPYLTVIVEQENDKTNNKNDIKSIQLLGNKWDKFIGLYINLNQENLNYSFYIELSNEFKEFIIGKKFGKINKIEKSCNMKCKVSILINNEKNKSNKEFITLELKSDSFIEIINCLKLIQLELPYEKKLYIPEAFHKFIIGMNGENIQSIMRRYNCFIQFLNTFDIRQNEYSFIRHSNVVIRCPLKNYDNVNKVVKELHSLSMEIFNLSKIQTLENTNNNNSHDLTGIKLLKLRKKELDLMLFSNGEKKLHKFIGDLEMKYNLFIRFPEFDEKKTSEEELFIILKSCKHNTVLKLEAGEGNMTILKLKTTNDKINGAMEEEDENLKLCFEELIEKYIPKKDKNFSAKENADSQLTMKNLSEDLKKMILWKYNFLIDQDPKDSTKFIVSTL